MTAAELFPYPPSPAAVPPDLTNPGRAYRRQVVVVCLSLIGFVLIYGALLLGSATVLVLFLTTPIAPDPAEPDVSWQAAAARVFCSLLFGIVFLYLLKGVFKAERPEAPAVRVEVTEGDQPRLFAFIRRLCEETGAPPPRRVFVTPEVTAEMFYESSFLSLVRQVPKNLVIGLGLVNVLNLSEFKAVLAHELGHFSQRELQLGGYVYLCNRVLRGVVFGRDWLDRAVAELQAGGPISMFLGIVAHGFLWLLRTGLEVLFNALNVFNLVLTRQMEFHADLIAVSVSGSDPLLHSLARMEFARESLRQAMNDLGTAADHRLYSSDLFYHQTRAGEHLRGLRRDPTLGEPPPAPPGGPQTTFIFPPEEADASAGWWATHPSNYDRERNAKARYVPAVIDPRPAWEAFTDPAGLRAKLTQQHYRITRHVLRFELSPADPAVVQAFIDDEHAESASRESYHGLYDGRFLHLDDLELLTCQARRDPHRDGELTAALADLTGDRMRAWAREFTRRQNEYVMLKQAAWGPGAERPRALHFRGKQYGPGEASVLFRAVDQELDADLRRLAEFDVYVFQTFYRMAQRLDPGLAGELVDRYVFHVEIQRLIRRLVRADAEVQHLLDRFRSEVQNPQQFAGLVRGLRVGRAELAGCLGFASGLCLPVLKNLPAGQPPSAFLLGEPVLDDLPPDCRRIGSKWIKTLRRQAATMIDRASRLHAKSTGGILILQEELGRVWVTHGPGPRTSDVTPTGRG